MLIAETVKTQTAFVVHGFRVASGGHFVGKLARAVPRDDEFQEFLARRLGRHSDSFAQKYPGELTYKQALANIDDIAEYKAPALLFSGGEPLTRPDTLELMEYATTKVLRVTLSTNGNLIDEPIAARLKKIGTTYVGISLDGIGETNDLFRGKKGAFDAAVRGFRNCTAVGQKVGLRLTLTRRNCADLHDIFDFIQHEGHNHGADADVPRAWRYARDSYRQ